MVTDERRNTCAVPLLGLILVAAAAACGTSAGATGADATGSPEQDVVQLRLATLPSPLGLLAVHHWFAAFDAAEGRWSRWEVWQNAELVPTSWGHVHRDLMPPDAGVGGGPFRVAREWRGRAARRILAVLAQPGDYPHRATYRAWPGPNSNTYAAWVLREAGVSVDPHPMGVGKDYAGLLVGGLSPTRTGLRLDTAILGLAVGVEDGAEIHVLGLTLGVDLWPPALKTPLGRLGFPEPVGPDAEGPGR